MKYIKILKLSFTLALMSFIFVSCSETVSYNQEAVRMYMKNIINNSTFSNFNIEMQQYQADTNIISQIKATFDSTRHRVYMFANFSCGCTSQQTDIAHLCRVLSDSKIDTNFYEIYSMAQATDKQPYMGLLTLKFLPDIIVMKDTNAVYFILDTMLLSNTNPPIEQLLLKGLQK